MISRRAFLGLLAAPLMLPQAAHGQPPAPLRIGWLSTGPHPFIDAFRQGLHDLGYVEGQSVVIEERYAEAQPERLPGLARDLIGRKVDIFVTSGSAAAFAAREATASVPIISVTSDLVAMGLVSSLGHPGGNITGLAILSTDVSVKWLELLKQALPKLMRVGVLVDASAYSHVALQRMEAAAPALGLHLIPLEARDPPGIDQAFTRAVNEHVGGLVPVSSPWFAARKQQLVALAGKHRLPVMYEHRDFVEAGGLMSYGPDLRDVFRRAAVYVDRIVKGAKPADLPVEQATKFELVINLKTAKALGLTIPPSLLLRADQVIE